MIKKIFVILIGVIFAGVGVYMLKQSDDLSERCTQEAIGTVVGVDEQLNDSSTSIEYTYYPVVQYTVGDHQITKEYSTGSGAPKYHEGQQINIMYDPQNEEDYVIVGDNNANFLGIIFTAIGIFVAVCGTKEF